MKTLAVALLAAGGLALAAPAHAQDFWFGIGPFGFGAAQYAYSYTPYWGGPYVYEPPLTSDYIAAPEYTYTVPAYEATYASVPAYTYEYVPTYSYGSTHRYTVAHYSYPSYYQPQYSYRRSLARMYEPRRNYDLRYTQAFNTTHRRYHARYAVTRPTGEAYRAEASAPVTNTEKTNARSPYCKMAKQERNPVSWNAYYHCLSR